MENEKELMEFLEQLESEVENWEDERIKRLKRQSEEQGFINIVNVLENELEKRFDLYQEKEIEYMNNYAKSYYNNLDSEHDTFSIDDTRRIEHMKYNDR